MAAAGVVSPQTAMTKPGGGMVTALLNRPIVLSLVLVVATVALYAPVHTHPFINYDDNDYVYENPHVLSGLNWSTVKWAFTTRTAANWHPLTWLSHALDCELFGQSPAGPHDVNVLFHAVNAVLLFWVLLRATGFSGRSFMVAALFALHPINVESVAWIAERKNVLCMMFFLLALGAYRWYASRPGIGRYVVVASLYGLGLMAKPQIITFPFVLLLWDYWPLQRNSSAGGQNSPEMSASVFPQKSWVGLVVEKTPLFLITAASALITMHVQHSARSWFPHWSRAGNAVLAYGLYLKKAIWPSDLAPLYPHPGTSLKWEPVIISALILLAITILVLLGRRHRYLPVGWFWFLGTLVPMMGIVQVGMQSMADRYAYVSFLGLFIMICWGVAEWTEQKRLSGAVLPSLSILVLLILGVVARRQVDYWKVEEVLWRHTLQITTRNWVAEGELAATLAAHGKVPEALPHFDNALAINPDDMNSNLGVAIYQLEQGHFEDAIAHYRKVAADQQLSPNVLQSVYLGMAKAYHALGDRSKVQECLQAAKKLSTESAPQ